MDALRFGLLIPQDAPVDELVQRARTAEDLGFDQVFVADHSADFRHPSTYWLDGWTVLAVLARETSRARVGTLVSNPIIRPPAILAKAAASVDHLSGGRLELGIGTGIARFDHAAAGEPSWTPAERVARFAEYVTIVDGLLTSAEHPFTFRGRHLATHETSLVPAPVQRPRPPIIVAGQSPTVRRVAVEIAEAWNTHGPYGADLEEIAAITERQNAELDRACGELGRDPATLRRSLLTFGRVDPWASADAFEEVVARFIRTGIREFVVFWPENDEQRRRFEAAATKVMPSLRER